MTVLQVPRDGWTTDDLPDTDFRYELVDGALLVTPPPEFQHVVLANELAHLLAGLVGPAWGSATDPGVYFDRRNYREPDVVIYRRSAIARGRLQPGDVLLAVEVMSPRSVATDRIAKPAQYAAAGIVHFWRIEQDPLTLVTHVLEGRVYRETGRHEGEVDVQEPVSLRIRLGDLLGR